MTLALKTEYQSFYDDTPKQEIKNDFLLFFLPKSRKEVRVLPNPHFDITITQRSKGQSAVAGAAYQSGEKLFSEYDQKTKNYSGKRGILYTEIMLPSHAPPEYANRETLWNSVEAAEK